jgi:hypothetical protein
MASRYRTSSDFDLGSGTHGPPALAFCFPIGGDSIVCTSRRKLNEHQKLIRDTVRQFMENEARPVRQRDRDRRLTAAELTAASAPSTPSPPANSAPPSPLPPIPRRAKADPGLHPTAF